ncbi:pyridoxamine 5'-phosphate oxidase family protein [Streptomyces sp. NPDC051940]|uniref:pyridoxamine 5'-phosphate oxidase family protein n=1 Tax=Streptomyces sp. NPDC051940 TaxID=3155675 RepID=UPI0034403679
MQSPRLLQLSRAESLQLLTETAVGRVAFSHRALPAIRPVNYVVHDGFVVVCTHRDSDLPGPSAFSGVVAFESDAMDPHTRTGWSVVVTGTATPVADEDLRARYRDLLDPWLGVDVDQLVTITTDMVSGIRLVNERREAKPR